MAGQAKQQVQLMQGAQMTLASAAGYSATFTSMLRPSCTCRRAWLSRMTGEPYLSTLQSSWTTRR